jgi:hypothetical protein
MCAAPSLPCGLLLPEINFCDDDICLKDAPSYSDNACLLIWPSLNNIKRYVDYHTDCNKSVLAALETG